MVLLIIALFAIPGVIFVATQMKVHTLYLASGVDGGAFERSTLALATALEEHGVDVELVNVPDSARNTTALSRSDSPVNAAFVAMPVTKSTTSGVSSAGTISLFPIAIMGKAVTTGPRPDIRQLKGTRIEVGAVGSMREFTATTILSQYGVTAENSTFLHAAQEASIENVILGTADYFVALVDPLDSRIDGIAGMETLQGIRIPDAEGLSARDGYTVPVTLPVGGFGMDPAIPSTPYPTVAVPVSLMVNDGLSDEVVYKIADYLSTEYGRGSVTALPGEFPNFSDRQVPPAPAAADYYSTGKVPWEFEILPGQIADLFLPIIVGVSVFLVFATVYQVLFPDSLSLWRGTLQPRRREKALARLEEAVADGRELTPSERRLLSRILAEQDRERSHQQRADGMRSLLDDPVHPDAGS